MNRSLKFPKFWSFLCGDICKTILTIKNHQFLMYFAYFHSFLPPKATKMDNFLIFMEFFGNKISKCPNKKKKMSPVRANRLLSSLRNKLKFFPVISYHPVIPDIQGQCQRRVQKPVQERVPGGLPRTHSWRERLPGMFPGTQTGKFF